MSNAVCVHLLEYLFRFNMSLRLGQWLCAVKDVFVGEINLISI